MAAGLPKRTPLVDNRPVVRSIRLPDGTRVRALRRLEALFLYREIFVDRVYAGPEVRRGGCVVDAGAHIGMFALWASRHLEPGRLVLVEPIPDTFHVLEANARVHYPAAERLNVGLGREPGTQRFRTYPSAAGWASIESREELLRESLLPFLRRGSLGLPVALFKLLGRISPSVQRSIYDLVCDRIFAGRVDVDCPVTTLSELMANLEIQFIDLLKLDVEGSELLVLQGLKPEHWARLGAVTAEVEDVSGRLAALRQLLEYNGLLTRRHQPPALAGTPFHVVTASR